MARIFQLSLQLIGAAGFALALGSTLAVAQTTQQHIHEMGHTVMPFDLNMTTHVFRMTDSGGVQSVVVKDAQDKDQIGLIRQHLQHEAVLSARRLCGSHVSSWHSDARCVGAREPSRRDRRLLFRVTAWRGTPFHNA